MNTEGTTGNDGTATEGRLQEDSDDYKMRWREGHEMTEGQLCERTLKDRKDEI